jgi:hypothetical protein
MVEVDGGLTVKLRETTESQPFEPTTVLLYKPDKVSDWLPKVYDCPAHMVALMDPVVMGLTVKVNDTTESQPVEASKVWLYTPVALKV